MNAGPQTLPANSNGQWQTLVEVTRGNMVESHHIGAAVVADAAGNVEVSWGDFEQPVYPRSAIKSLQALAIVETGAADAFEVSPEELALACASHGGEPMHTTRVAAWLDRIGCSVDDLLCGPQWPTHEPTTRTMIAAGEEPTRLHNNCSGKHTGMLTTVLHKGEALTGYTATTHPSQQRILGILERMTGQELGSAPWGIDGCSLPTVATSLGGLAVAMARLAAPDDQPDRRIDAAERVKAAWSGYPELMSGTDRFDAAINRALNGRAMVKIGAEGVFCACLDEMKLGLALKIADGASRAAEVAVAGILNKLGVLTNDQMDELSDWTRPTLLNRAGLEIGEVRLAKGV
ncbi:MAG: asparaginase [Pseudomonadota bacterium]